MPRKKKIEEVKRLNPEESLRQLKMCALGKCDSCAYNDEGGCITRIESAYESVFAHMVKCESVIEIFLGSFMNLPEGAEIEGIEVVEEEGVSS